LPASRGGTRIEDAAYGRQNFLATQSAGGLEKLPCNARDVLADDHAVAGAMQQRKGPDFNSQGAVTQIAPPDAFSAGEAL
jgi:hypothetical protein